MSDMPAALGPALFSASFKVLAADFRVDEVLGIEPDGAGEHWLLQIEKTATNTDEVASLLESTCSANSADVGLSGMKDRHAVTTQWFSVRSPVPREQIEQALQTFNEQQTASAAASGGKQLRLLQAARHSRKLRRGTHSANAFVIILRDLNALAELDDADLASRVKQRLEQIRQCGFPNYIGPQRFGRGGQNLVRARQWFRQPKKRTSRQQRSLWLSAARSELFNRVCAARVENDNWQQLLAGEPAALAGSRSFFDSETESAEDLAARLSRFDIHPSAPWWGRGRTLASSTCAQFEESVLSNAADLCAGLERSGLPQERRALRACATDLQHEWLDARTLQLAFHLSPGVFATTLLRELGLCAEPER
ncbi:tRNA pseudouridine(13) synthase TruD [Granulosicoccus sp. 3-233]|uniref:tRNA pseudouridine(13) synthase TruD n=1 Tax=Granulosicoccus sp. 3-233 TaxID=3417969 RepID=UPI003D327F73